MGLFDDLKEYRDALLLPSKRLEDRIQKAANEAAERGEDISTFTLWWRGHTIIGQFYWAVIVLTFLYRIALDWPTQADPPWWLALGISLFTSAFWPLFWGVRIYEAFP